MEDLEEGVQDEDGEDEEHDAHDPGLERAPGPRQHAAARHDAAASPAEEDDIEEKEEQTCRHHNNQKTTHEPRSPDHSRTIARVVLYVPIIAGGVASKLSD